MLRTVKHRLFNYIFLQIQQMSASKEQYNVENLKKLLKSVGISFWIGIDYIIINPENIEIGEKFSAGRRIRIEAICDYMGDIFNPKILIKDNVAFGTDVHIGCINYVEIGNNCLFGSRILITDHNHGDINIENLKLPPKERPLISKGPVIIKDNVWIGDGVVIMSNVTIGENSIVGANAVVTKDVPAFSVAIGVPAKIYCQE